MTNEENPDVLLCMRVRWFDIDLAIAWDLFTQEEQINQSVSWALQELCLNESYSMPSLFIIEEHDLVTHIL